ncbi:MAG: ABC transporter ATP-binding protein [Firmicutes bacterium]|nr:ABC transporter ATP-binding protein [Bacillota bacterium]
MYSWGESLKVYRDGTVCGVLDMMYVLEMVVRIMIPDKEYVTVLALLQLILFVFVFIYRVRLFLELLKLFGRGRKWILLYLIRDWLPILILGVSNKYQPRHETIKEEHWQAGMKLLPKEDELCNAVPLINEGLSIQIRERAVREFGKKRYLLDDIALNIPERSLVLLLGGSGAGKTTMINAVIGYEKADATILLNGVDIYNDYESVKHDIGFVPQQNLIRGKDTVMRTVDDAARIRLPKGMSKEEKRKKISEIMELLGLSSGKAGLVAKKSGGQLRRICIATELITDPVLFILDEPDSGLDGAISREIFTKLRQIADEGRIVIVITHTPDRVIDLFDKVIVLARDSGRVGRLAFYGSPQEAREFFERDTMEEIVRSVNGKEEGGEGHADEMIEKYTKLVVSGHADEMIEEPMKQVVSGKGGENA